MFKLDFIFPEITRDSLHRVFTTRHESGAHLIVLAVLVLAFGTSFLVSVLPNDAWFYDYQVDKLVHATAAGAVALLFLPYFKSAWVAVIIAGVVGIGFEVVEAQFTPIGGYGGVTLFVIDTTLDILVDVGGAWLVAFPLKKYIYG